MKKLGEKGSALVIILLVVVVALAAGAGYYVWKQNQDKKDQPTNTTSQTATEPDTSNPTVVTLPDGFVKDPAKAQALQEKSTVNGVEYYYFTNLDTATIVTVMTRPKTSKDMSAIVTSNAEASTQAKIEFPSAKTVATKSINVKGDGTAGYLVQVNDTAKNIFVSYIGAASDERVALVTVRSPDAYKTQQEALVQDLISSMQL